MLCLDPGSGRKIPARCHGAGVYHGVLSQKPSTKNGINRHICNIILSVAWQTCLRALVQDQRQRRQRRDERGTCAMGKVRYFVFSDERCEIHM